MNKLIIDRVVPAIRMLTSPDKMMSVRFDDRKELLSAEDEDDLLKVDFVKKPGGILVVDETTEPEEIIEDLEVKLSTWAETRSVHPDYILLKGIGLVAIAPDAASLDLLFGAQEMPVIKVSGRALDKIAIVTGGVLSLGRGIAEHLYAQGANVVIADLNVEAGEKLASSLNAKRQTNRAWFVKVNVADPESVEGMIAATVKHFGGLDVIICNTTILHIGGLDEMNPDIFSVMTDVNYKGYFLCAKYASAIMKVQAQFKEGHFMDIIQINPGAGQRVGNRVFAYVGGDFGGIGLTQSFARELMPYRIKVNSICPGNFFDGPILGVPEKRMFLRPKTAKVPEKKDSEDVKTFYEDLVPTGRGCRVIDVVRAVLYVMEQEHETGQAIPVMGGLIC